MYGSLGRCRKGSKGGFSGLGIGGSQGAVRGVWGSRGSGDGGSKRKSSGSGIGGSGLLGPKRPCRKTLPRHVLLYRKP